MTLHAVWAPEVKARGVVLEFKEADTDHLFADADLNGVGQDERRRRAQRANWPRTRESVATDECRQSRRCACRVSRAGPTSLGRSRDAGMTQAPTELARFAQ